MGKGQDMARRQAEGGEAAVDTLSSVPGTQAENSIARRAATARSRSKALARRLRRSSRMATLTADISEGIERVAGLSDRIIASFEQARARTDAVLRESGEGVRLLEELADASGEIRELSAGNAIALEELLADFRVNAGATRQLIIAIQTSAEHHSDLLRTVQELSRAGEELTSLSGRLERLLERADVAGLNAALEAGKAGESGAGFAVAASMAQKEFASFDRKAGEFLTLLGRTGEAHEGLSTRIGTAADRIRAIVVMTKGVRNALDDAAGTIEELRGLTLDAVAKLQGVLEGMDAVAPALDALPGSVDRVLVSIEQAASRIEEQEEAFSGAAGHAERLLTSTGHMTSAGDLSAALDEVYTDSDTFIRSLETTVERVGVTIESIHDVLHALELLKRGTGGHRASLESLIRTADEALAESDTFQNRMTGLRGNLESALGVLRDVARELGVLREDEEAITAGLDALRPLYSGVSRFSGRLGVYAGTMAALAAMGGMEAVRSGNARDGFAGLAGEFEAVAEESDSLEGVVGGLGERLEERLHSMGCSQARMDWRGLAGSFEGVIAGMQTMIETRLDGAVRHSRSLAAALSGHGKGIAGVMARTDAVETAAGDAVRSVTEAVGQGEGQQESFRQILALAEKVTVLADELYPEEEV